MRPIHWMHASDASHPFFNLHAVVHRRAWAADPRPAVRRHPLVADSLRRRYAPARLAAARATLVLFVGTVTEDGVSLDKDERM
jgi:hypothetical protein